MVALMSKKPLGTRIADLAKARDEREAERDDAIAVVQSLQAQLSALYPNMDPALRHAWYMRVLEAIVTIPDFIEVCADNPTPIPDHIQAACAQSMMGVRILHLIAKGDHEARELLSLPVPWSMRAFGRLEEKLIQQDGQSYLVAAILAGARL
jgi:hypothetical protein